MKRQEEISGSLSWNGQLNTRKRGDRGLKSEPGNISGKKNHRQEARRQNNTITNRKSDELKRNRTGKKSRTSWEGKKITNKTEKKNYKKLWAHLSIR